MKKTEKSMLKPTVIFLIGIILMALSFAFWYFMVSPVVSLGTHSVSERAVSKSVVNASNLILYFGSIRFMQQDLVNKSRPVDYSLNLSLSLEANRPINVTIYIRDSPIFSARTNETVQKIVCNSTIYKNYNSTNPAPSNHFPDVTDTISVSLLDAFLGGTTPYMIIKNLNTTSSTSVTYTYSYKALFRNSNGIPLLMFIIGVVIAIIEGVVFIKYVIKQVRQR